MGNFETRPTTPADIHTLASRLRPGDLCEIALFGVSPRKGLWRSYKASLICRTGFVDDEILGVWGVTGTVLGDVGRAWLMTSTACDRYPLAFAKFYRTEVRRMLKGFTVLEVVADAGYTKATKMLELAGFRLREKTPIGDGMSSTYEMTNAD